MISLQRTGLTVGQWIQFSTKKDLSDKKPKIQAIYKENQCFLVISRQDTFLDDPCECFLVDINGEIYDYSPRMFSLNNKYLKKDSEITVISKENVEKIHGEQKVRAAYETGQKHLEKYADYFVKFPGRLLKKEGS